MTSGANAGFTEGTPWFYVNPNYEKINVEAQESDHNSLLNFYRKAIALLKPYGSRVYLWETKQ